jgi:hypothetical protein
MSVDTKHTDRRTLRFESLADMRRDLDALEAAHRRGSLHRTGNWTEGEIFTHLAAFINYGYDGYPKEISPPWIVALLFIRWRRSSYMRKGFPAGVRIPGTSRGTIGMENVSFDEGLARLRAALDRLEASHAPHPSPAFGPMTHPEQIKFQLRHAELHLGFLHTT